MPLVKSQLARYRRGDRGDYVGAENAAEFDSVAAVSAKMAAVFYQEVPVCENCYKVYNFVDDARHRALQKLEHQRKPKSASSKPASVAAAVTPHDVEASRGSLRAAIQAIDGLTKLDVAEIRTMVNPPAAVEVVLEAVMVLLTGKVMTFHDTRRLLNGGEAFLLMLQQFRVEDVTDARLKLAESYADNPVFRPKNVEPVSACAAKFCAWVLGVVQAARWHRGLGHRRTDPLLPVGAGGGGDGDDDGGGGGGVPSADVPFHQKLAKAKAKRRGGQPPAQVDDHSGKLKGRAGGKFTSLLRGDSPPTSMMNLNSMHQPTPQLPPVQTLSQSHYPQPTHGGRASSPMQQQQQSRPQQPALTKRQRNAIAASQQKTTDRLTALNSVSALGGTAKEFRCSDGITVMPYIVMGNLSVSVKRCNFVVVHDFFDTADATSLLMKNITQHHDGCQALCFNYPGQSNTVWPRLPAAERDRGALEPVHNNDWVADRLHELLQYVESQGDFLLSNPFHVVGFGNGACIGAAFVQRYGNHPAYASSIRSFVSINGFLCPDPQLTAILHSASELFENTTHSRPDIPVAFWSRFIFSEDYLTRVSPNLALNILTAVSNPVTNEGRTKVARGALQHRDLRGGLAPDLPERNVVATVLGTGAPAAGGPGGGGAAVSSVLTLTPVQIPVVVLQSTENLLVNAANVDSFLTGRNTKHLWSHQLNVISAAALSQAQDPTANWVGKMASGPADYAKFSILGKPGLRMLLDVMANPRGAFVMWARTGHCVQQENKGAVLDLLDALAMPSTDYVGEDLGDSAQQPVPTSAAPPAGGGPGGLPERDRKAIARSIPKPVVDQLEVESITSKMEVMFKLNPPPRKTVETGRTVGSAEAAGKATQVAVEEEEDEEEEPIDATVTLKLPSSSSGGTALPHDIVSAAAVDDEDDDDDDDAPIGVPAPAAMVAVTPADAPAEESKTQSKPASRPSSSASSRLAGGGAGSSALPWAEQEAPTRPTTTPGAVRFSDEDRRTAAAAATAAAADEAEPLTLSSPPLTALAPAPAAVTRLDDLSQHEATEEQKQRKEWTADVPTANDAIALEAELAKRQKDYVDLEAKIRDRRAQEAAARLSRLEEEQTLRRKQYEDEDKLLLEKLQLELESRRREREAADKQRRLQILAIEQVLVDGGLIAPYDPAAAADVAAQPSAALAPAAAATAAVVAALAPAPALAPVREPVREMPPMKYAETGGGAVPTPAEDTGVTAQLDRMVALEEEARKKGTMTVEDYEQVKRKMVQRQVERDRKLRAMVGQGQEELMGDSALTIQRVGRGYIGRKKARAAALRRAQILALSVGMTKFQAVVRGVLSRKRSNEMKRLYLMNKLRGSSAIKIQSAFRGHVARRYVRKLRRFVKARDIQRCFRGHLGRQAANRERERLRLIKMKNLAASKIQACWRMKVAKEEFRSLRIHMLAAQEIQRCFRGYTGRKMVARRRKWEAATPGPERIKLGLQMIEESKAAFERQQEEIDALHRAQERAEARVSFIHAELKDSEQELVVLERELQEIDQIERDLITLTHERNVLASGITDAAGMPRTAAKGGEALVLGHESTPLDDPDLERRKKAEAYALEMTIQIKRAEREKKRQELETEFSAVFQEVEKKKKALERLELSLADMEATRERKDREFRRLQKNLMQLLLEQKQELDDLREKGIELETATAVTAAAATATAMKAKEHEKRSTVMFSQTEELMKFQFMSMSLSYFSSLNMLKQLRDMNSDTTSAAIAASADAAASSAAAAAAANLPSVKRLEMGAGDFVEQSIQRKKAELAASENAEKEIAKVKANPLPDNVRTWSVADVCRWLDALSLSQYAAAFKDATVDGPFLMELREEDMVQVLGISHKLHVRKILVSREKLKPLSEQEMRMKDTVEREERADMRRAGGPPDVPTVFSQARNGRIKRVEESLNLGFPVDGEDEKGNTLLLVACQNNNRRLVELLLVRGANINHQNAQGNTALHFALAFDPEGLLGEYLIEHGADDTIENVEGLVPYDGCGGN